MATPADTAAPISAEGKTIFFTGATGYIGGTVLTALIGLSAPPSKITCLIRDPKKIELLKDVSVSAKTQLEGVQGSLSDVDVIVKAASEADVVVSCADCDDMTSIKAMLEGMKKRKKATGHRSLFIHTTGTAMFCDGAKGNYPNDKIYTDLNPTPATAKTPALLSIATLPESAWHRECDLAILAADATSGCKAYFIAPSTIWGEPKGQVFDIGFSNPFSQQMPNLIKVALDRGEAGMIGKGANIWPHVAISDLAELYKLVYAGAQRGNIGHGASGFYLGISGEYTWRAAASSIGAALVDNKWAKTSQPSTFSHEEVLKYFGDSGESICGGNSRGVADRSKSIGWRPKLNEIEDFVGDLKKETVRYQKVKGSKA